MGWGGITLVGGIFPHPFVQENTPTHSCNISPYCSIVRLVLWAVSDAYQMERPISSVQGNVFNYCQKLMGDFQQCQYQWTSFRGEQHELVLTASSGGWSPDETKGTRSLVYVCVGGGGGRGGCSWREVCQMTTRDNWSSVLTIDW